MQETAFSQSVDPTRRDRLRGEILAFISEFESQGYHNMEIVRALLWSAYNRARREDWPVFESFLESARDDAQESLRNGSALIRSFTKENEKNKFN